MRIEPPTHGDVRWPADEGTIGVVGVAPWATLDFCARLHRLVPAEKDWHYPRVLVDMNPKIPSRGRHLQLGETDPSPHIHRTIVELATAGATVCVVPCNTAHLLYSRWSVDLPVPVPHIHACVVEAITRGPVAVLASASVSESHQIEDRIAAAGWETLDPTPWQSRVSALIEAVKKGESRSSEPRHDFQKLVSELRAAGARSLVLACTELPLLGPVELVEDLEILDSSEELARRALRSAGVGSCVGVG